MAMMKKALQKHYVQIPNETARAVEAKAKNPLSLQAFGLIAHLWSYNVETWELFKTELYKRFAFNKKTSVSNAWDELVENRYILEFKYQEGKIWKYFYLYDIQPMSDERIKQEIQEIVELLGLESADELKPLKTTPVDYEHHVLNSSKRTVQNPQVSNTILTKNPTKEIKTSSSSFDDDEKEKDNKRVRVNDFAFQEFKTEFQNNFPSNFDEDMFVRIYEQMETQGLAIITYKEALIQARYMQERIDSGELSVGDYAAYFVGGIIKKRTSEQSALLQRQIDKRQKELTERKELDRQARLAELELDSLEEENKRESAKSVEAPSYDWFTKGLS